MVKFKAGDRIKATQANAQWPRGAGGVVQSEIGNDWYTVEFDSYGVHMLKDVEIELVSSAGLPIGSMYGAMDDFTLFLDDTGPMRPKCECGQTDEIWVKHSDWCKLGQYLKNA